MYELVLREVFADLAGQRFMFWALLFFGLTMPGLSGVTLNDLVDAAKWFSAAMRKQLEIVQSNPSPTELAEMTIDYAQSKVAYFEALAEEMPELTDIATGKQARPPELDKFAKAFSVIGEEQEKVADKETLILLKRFDHNSDVEKAQAEFDRAQKVEERFHREFDRIEFTSR